MIFFLLLNEWDWNLESVTSTLWSRAHCDTPLEFKRNEIHEITTLKISHSCASLSFLGNQTKCKQNSIQPIKMWTLTYPLTELVVAVCVTSGFEYSQAKAVVFEVEHPEDQATKCLLWCLLRATRVVANVRTRVTGELKLRQSLAKIEAKLTVTEPIFIWEIRCVYERERERERERWGLAEILLGDGLSWASKGQ